MATSFKQAYNDTQPANPFGPPDWSILEEGRRKAPPLPPEMFGPAWGELQKLASDKGAPDDYVALCWLVVVASLIGAKRRAVPYAGSSWHEPSILWLGLVGDPSHNKSPALDPLLSILRKLEEERADDFEREMTAWRGDCERAKAAFGAYQEAVKTSLKEGLPNPPMPDEAAEPAKPVRHRYIIQDCTPESVGSILAGNPQGALMVRDELAGWLESFDRYNAGGRAYWLEAFGGRSYTIDRKGNADPLRIPYNGVNAVGGIQPGKLAETLLHSTDDGLAARLLFTWPSRRPWSRPSATANLAAFENAARRLDDLAWSYDDTGKRGHVPVLLDDDAADIFDRLQQFYRDQEAEASAKLKSFVGKLSGLTLRLALAAEFAKWAYAGGPEPRTISAATIEAVGDFIASYALPMAERVYGDAALPLVERNAATLARHLKKTRQRSVNARALRREDRLPGLREAEAVAEAIDALVEANWLHPEPTRRGGGNGRQSSDYTVNPAIWGDA